VADAATWHRCRQLGKPLPARPERETFAERVAWLVTEGVIVDAWWWDTPANPDVGIRMARNLTSHATFQQLDTPDNALAEVHYVAQRINELFARSREAGES
jgi:hypothetical protein